MSNVWQKPYVNVFKHFNVAQWKNALKEGDIVAVMDKYIKATVYKITGHIPAGNYIQLPRTGAQPLGLTGRYFYLLFLPIPTKYFVTHVDVVTTDSLVIRLSFSNLFKEFKSTATWLQFPFICNPSKGSVAFYAADGAKDNIGPAPSATRWTVVCLDLNYILCEYVNCKYSHIKSIRLCANMLVKNVFTSDFLYDPGITMAESKLIKPDWHICPMPREFGFPLDKGDLWDDFYDLIRFPPDGQRKPFDSVQHVVTRGPNNFIAGDKVADVPYRIMFPTKSVSKCVSERVSMIHKLTTPKKPLRKQHVTEQLPELKSKNGGICDASDVHVYAHPDVPDSLIDNPSKQRRRPMPGKKMEPNPVTKLKKVIGYGGACKRDVLWSGDGSRVIYPCHTIVVVMKISNGRQCHLIGHTDNVSCLALDGKSDVLASGQTGQESVVRLWRIQTGECLSLVQTHTHSLHCVSFSQDGTHLCGVGKDRQGKNLVVLWNTSAVGTKHEITVLVKAHTDVNITRMVIAPFNDSRMVSCGRDNIRFWRVKDGSIRSAPVSIREYGVVDFTDICFAPIMHNVNNEGDVFMYACSRSGHLFKLDYWKVAVVHTHSLLHLPSQRKDKSEIHSGSGQAITSISVNETFCVTGSEDGFLRLWPLDFAHVYLEAEHEGAVTAVCFSPDGFKILAGTAAGNLGILDVTCKVYTTVMRSHTDRVGCIALDSHGKHLASVSDDGTVRVWDTDTLQQLYDFSIDMEQPITVCYHPSCPVFACGFMSGAVYVFDVSSTCLLSKSSLHQDSITGVVYSPDGEYLYSSCCKGILVAYSASDRSYAVIRTLPHTVAKGTHLGPCALAVSSCGRRLAFVGPSQFMVTILDARYLSELVHINIASIGPCDPRAPVDTAMSVVYSSEEIGHLLVATSNKRLIKLDHNGCLVSQVKNIYSSVCNCMTASTDGRVVLMAAGNVMKMWDSEMKSECQTFACHSEQVSRILYSPDSKNIVSTGGQAIFFWDDLAVRPATPPVLGRVLTAEVTSCDGQTWPHAMRKMSSVSVEEGVPVVEYDDTMVTMQTCRTDLASENYLAFSGDDQIDKKASQYLKEDDPSSTVRMSEELPCDVQGVSRPTCIKHFLARQTAHNLAKHRYTAPPNQAGLRLSTSFGYNGNGRDNMIWCPESGFFAYTIGCLVVVEDLLTGEQKHLQGHLEEVSTLALQNDMKVLASASATVHESNNCRICLWDVNSEVCRRVICHHGHQVTSMTYSSDDRFLLIVGDFHDCEIVLFSTSTFLTVASTQPTHTVHSVRWDPVAVGEFASVGEHASLCFWLLDECCGSNGFQLSLHEADVPSELMLSSDDNTARESTARFMSSMMVMVSFTALAYGESTTLFVASSNGRVSVWDTTSNSCYLHWNASPSEIGCLCPGVGKLLTGSSVGQLRVWDVKSVFSVQASTRTPCSTQSSGINMDDEMSIDGAIVSACFDDVLEMGVVGTINGTLWCINWPERSGIRVIAGHPASITGLAMAPSGLMATSCVDGCVRVWTLRSKELALQFEVKDQVCTCLAFSRVPVSGGWAQPSCTINDFGVQRVPPLAAGYGDGSVRLFDVSGAVTTGCLQTHCSAVTAIAFSADGLMVLSGGNNGRIAISSWMSGITVRVITDHGESSISCIDVGTMAGCHGDELQSKLWLACSTDNKISIWSSHWNHDTCELVDRIAFPASEDRRPSSPPPIALAKFSPREPDVIVYVGYNLDSCCCLQFYSLSQHKVARTIPLNIRTACLDLTPDTRFIAVGVTERLVKLVDYHNGNLQDYAAHDDVVTALSFTLDGSQLVTVCGAHVLLWDVTV